MVTINATLLIELVLFLVFLWGTQRYILTPVLKSLDDREESIEKNRVQSEADNSEAETFEKKYRREIAVIRRQADENVRAAQEKSQQDHAKFLIDERARAEQAVAEVRQEAQRLVESQHDAIMAAVPDLVEQMQAKLTAGGES